MKKVYIFAGLILAISVIFACTIPTSIEIKGSPKVKFTANIDFSEEISEMIKEGLDSSENANINKLNCTKGTPINGQVYQTFLFHMELINETFEFEYGGGTPGKINIPGLGEFEVTELPNQVIELSEDIPLKVIGGTQNPEPIKLNFSSLSEILPGFKFDESHITAKLYMDGSELIELINIELEIDSVPLESEGTPISAIPSFSREPSGINPDAGEYSGADLPNGGYIIDDFAPLLNDRDENGKEVTYSVKIPAGTTINTSSLGDVDVVVELVVWVPLYFIAESNDTEFEFPGDFMGGIGDFIDSIAEYMDSLTLVIDLNPNPFSKGTLVIKSTEVEIRKPLNNTSLIIPISKENMEKIVANSPFEPSFSIVFDNGENLGIPKELKITTVSLEAKLNYTIGN